MEETKKKQSILGYISIIIAILSFIIYLVSFFMYLEMATIILNLFAASIIGIILGLVGVIISAIQKRTAKRMAVWGIVLNILFVLFVIVFLSLAMGGP